MPVVWGMGCGMQRATVWQQTGRPHMQSLPWRGAGWHWRYLKTSLRLPRACCGQACIRSHSPVLAAAVDTIANAGFHRLPHAQSLHKMPAPIHRFDYLPVFRPLTLYPERAALLPLADGHSSQNWETFNKGLLQRNSTKHAPANKSRHHNGSSSNSSISIAAIDASIL